MESSTSLEIPNVRESPCIINNDFYKVKDHIDITGDYATVKKKIEKYFGESYPDYNRVSLGDDVYQLTWKEKDSEP